MTPSELILDGGRWLAARPLWAWRLLALVVLAGLSFYVMGQASLSVNGARYYWLDDDQMISMRYGRHLAEGKGLVWNDGERVEGYTNFLWTVVMAGVHLLGVPSPLTSLAVKLINLVLAGWILWLSEKLLRRLHPQARTAVPFLWLTLALCLDVVYWSANGFETTLLTAVFLLVIVRILGQKGAEWPTALLIGLLPLIRSDAYPLWGIAILLALAFSANRKRTAGWLALAAVLPVAHVLWRHSYYGEWLPNTYFLKVAGVDGRFQRGAKYLTVFVRNYGAPLVMAGLGAALLWRRQITLLLAGIVLGMGYILLVGDDIFPYSRFLAPYVPLLLALAFGAGLALVADGKARLLLFAVVSTAVLANVGAFQLNQLTSTNGEPARGVVAAVLIEQNTDPDATLAVSAAGVVPYFSQRYTFDMLGKSDPVIARLKPVPAVSVGHNKYDFTYSLNQEPDLVVSFASETAVAEWIRLADGDLSPAFRNRHFVALIYNEVFQREYLPNPIDLDFFRQQNMVFYRDTAVDRLHLDKWQEPILK